MRRLSSVFLLAFCLLFIVSQVSSAVFILRVDEASIKMSLLAETAEVTLPVENASTKNLTAVIKLSLIAPNGSFAASAVQSVTIKPNANTITLPLNFNYKKLKYDEQSKLLWYRLHYRIASDDATDSGANTVEGIVSLSQLLTNFFELHASAPKKVQQGGSVRVVARTTNPLSSKPIANLPVTATIEFDDEDKFKPLTAKAITNEHGYAILDFVLPRNLEGEDELDLTVTAKRGDFEQEANEDLEIDKGANIFVSTDKTLYQPGQTLHIRALAFDNGNRAIPNQSVSLVIKDYDYSVIHRDTIQTSRFGVASADWQIPNDAKLGDYTIQLELDSDKYEDTETLYQVKISRYDLPNFVVNTKTDKPYYTPEQTTAEVEVRADYLFGQPVKRGHVRVVREKERTWNYKEQKYDIDEGETHEGKTDEEGHYKAKLNLKEDLESLTENAPDYRDIRYAAYFTDPTTNRTEQRRFDVRVTKHPIHIYISRFSDNQHKDLPVDFFVTTNYADGTPVSCEVVIAEEVSVPPAVAGGSVIAPQSDVVSTDSSILLRPLQTVKTNRFGVAKVTGLKPQGGAEDRDDRVHLTLNAKDAQGKIGEVKKWFWFEDDDDVIRVNTDKTILRDGETIKATITSNVQDEFVIVDVVNNYRVIRTQTIQLRNGQASVMIPYSADFKGLISIVAYLPETGTRRYYSYYDSPIGSANVIYPNDQELKTNVRMSQAQYKPGDDAVINFDVRTPEGKTAESALGVVVFDKAVEERARTDSEFGGRFGFYNSMRKLLRDDNSVGGYSLRDLYKLDMKKPLPEGIDVLAQLLVGSTYYQPNFFDAYNFNSNYTNIFKPYIDTRFSLFTQTLNKKYQSGSVYPDDEETLQRLLHPSGISLKQLLDPWGTLYRYSFKAIGDNQILNVVSAGPDKRFGTDDDFTVNTISRRYFQFTGEAINRAVERFYTHTGNYLRNENQLKEELKREGIDFDSLRDPWGNAYRLNFYPSNNFYNTVVLSAGENGKFEEPNAKVSDDVTVWTCHFNYFLTDQARIENALISEYQATKRFPQNENELNEFLKKHGVDFDSLRDPWGQNYYATFRTDSRYADRSTTTTYIRYGEGSINKITPVTQTIQYMTIRSKGDDKQIGTIDDFNLADYSRLVSEQAADEPKPKMIDSLPNSSGQVGSLTGTIKDASGAVISGVEVKAKHISTGREFNTSSMDDGTFILRNLPIGFYEVRYDAQGFKTAVVSQVLVKQYVITTLNLTLEVGTINETVTVTASGETLLNAENSSISATVSARQISDLPLNARNPLSLVLLKPGTASDKFGTEQNEQLSTPRLREYFPETLVWMPSVETDKQGRAKINFKLGDNITTWKMSVVSSTADGKIGVEEKEFISFLPFFAEHDPPKILTEGDEISLPVVLRNYTEKTQLVDVEMKPENWFSFLGSPKQKTEVPKDDSKNAIFAFRAIASVESGKQRVTAHGSSESDAIEKPVTVHPDGEEKSFTVGNVFSNQAVLEVNLPNETIEKSQRAKLKIYPNLMAHVAESIEGILQRPYGCGEQTISSTYPSILILKANGGSPTVKEGLSQNISKPLLAKAHKYAKDGYKRLLNYRSDDGGFNYWGRGDADVALTAYAVRFLNDAKDVIDIDEDVLEKAREWLIKKQNADGSWHHYYYSDSSDWAKRQRAILTAYVARVLAQSNKSVPPPPAPTAGSQVSYPPATAGGTDSFKRALSFLRPQVDAFEEPYLLASYALIAIDAKETNEANRVIAKLETLSKQNGEGSYWALEANTPFYGWGLAGRVETTALVLQALSKKSVPPAVAGGSSRQSLINRGLLFILKQKDRYGVWYSTQATINVLDALISLLKRDERAPRADQTNKAEIFVGDKLVQTISLPMENELVDPLIVDLSNYVVTGNNKIEIRREGNTSPASAQLVVNYYVAWEQFDAERVKQSNSSLLRLSVNYDKPNTEISETITCNVEAERIGYRGYGMLLAEIGLPPGADVDRQSLDDAMKESGWSFSRYDVLPDKVVVYLWPSAGGVKFSFKFKPRYGIKAQTASSQMYDYYNPEARVVVAPTRFNVK